MKFRKGFVSNSSSSSYIIGEEIMDPLLRKAMEAVDEYESIKIPIKEVARQMLLASKRSDHIPHLDKMPDDIKLIVFSSCNYETEIMQLDSGNVVVLTCNNERDSWYDALAIIENKYSRSYRSIEESEDYDSLIYEHSSYGGDTKKFEELGGYDIYFTFNMEDFARDHGPAAYINESGAMLYKGDKRTCIK